MISRLTTEKDAAMDVAHPIPTHVAKPFPDPSLTFDTFEIGGRNRLAYAFAVSVASAFHKGYNPLYITGAAATGKTHLLHAIAQQATVWMPLRVVYVDLAHPCDVDSSWLGADILLLDNVDELGAVGTPAVGEAIIERIEHRRQIVAAGRGALPPQLQPANQKAVTVTTMG